jgi:hypothetical protein
LLPVVVADDKARRPIPRQSKAGCGFLQRSHDKEKRHGRGKEDIATEPTTPAPLISVITATYNWSSVLRYAIQSVLWQTLQDFEMLIIGDGCTDFGS